MTVSRWTRGVVGVAPVLEPTMPPVRLLFEFVVVLFPVLFPLPVPFALLVPVAAGAGSTPEPAGGAIGVCCAVPFAGALLTPAPAGGARGVVAAVPPCAGAVPVVAVPNVVPVLPAAPPEAPAEEPPALCANPAHATARLKMRMKQRRCCIKGLPIPSPLVASGGCGHEDYDDWITPWLIGDASGCTGFKAGERG